MNTPILIVLSLVLISSTSCGQPKSIDCDKNLDKVPYWASNNLTPEKDSLQADFTILKECGQLDSIDSELLSGPILGLILVEQATDGKEITYRSILKSFNEFKQTNNYKILRDSKILESKIVNLSNWETDKQLLKSVGMSESEITNLKEFVKLNSGDKMTFKQVCADYIASKPQEQTQETIKLQFADLGDLDNAIKLGKENKKTILIYFTCYACANARKIENNILTNEQVKTLITDNYVYFSAYVDDKTRDPNDNLTIGSKYFKLQSEKFKINSQPYFIIMDVKGNVVTSLGFTNSIDEFVNFLKKGIE